MSYLSVETFAQGMDRRRQRVAGTPGTLWLAQNVHITRGGDVERRKRFVPEYNVPGTFGVATVGVQIYVFGSADLAATMPTGIRYQRLQAVDGEAMTKIHDVKSFDGKFYVIAEYTTGHTYHFYDGSRVTDWDTLSASMGSHEFVAQRLAEKIDSSVVSATSFGTTVTITAREPGTAFTISKTVTDGDGNPDEDITLTEVVANVAEVAETLATADIQITAGSAGDDNAVDTITVNGVELLTTPVLWAGSNSATAIRIAAAILNGYGTHGYSATATGDTVTVSAAPGTGAAPNGYVVDVATGGDVTVSADTSMSGGVTAVEAVAQVYTAEIIGTFQRRDQFILTINGTQYAVTSGASGTGRSIFVGKHRVFVPVGSLWRYCKLDTANEWVDSDAGFVNVALEGEGNANIGVAVRYQNLAALFDESAVVLYQIDEDPDNILYSDTLENTGSVAPGSVIRYGNNDVFYLDVTGIRSLRARDSSNAPFVSDVGNAIDTFVQAQVAGMTRQQVAGAKAVIEPLDGRYWLNLAGRIFVLSYFPGTKVSAWTYYDLDEVDAEVQGLAKVRDKTYLRAGDDIYVYGGLSGDAYPEDDEGVAAVATQFLSGNTPATIKKLTGFDLAATNTWECDVLFDPNDDEKSSGVGSVARISFADANKVAVPGQTSMIALKMVCRKAGAATLSMAAVHYEGGEAG